MKPHDAHTRVFAEEETVKMSGDAWSHVRERAAGVCDGMSLCRWDQVMEP